MITVVAPVAPVVTPSSGCGVEGTYTVPTTTGVTYLLDGKVVAAAPTRSRDRHGDRQAAEGYRLSDSEWSFALKLACGRGLSGRGDPAGHAGGAHRHHAGGAHRHRFGHRGTAGACTIPATTGVTYLLDGKVVAAGTYPGPVSGTVTAEAAAGYQLDHQRVDLRPGRARGHGLRGDGDRAAEDRLVGPGSPQRGAIGLLVGFALLALGARRREDGEQV